MIYLYLHRFLADTIVPWMQRSSTSTLDLEDLQTEQFELQFTIITCNTIRQFYVNIYFQGVQ